MWTAAIYTYTVLAESGERTQNTLYVPVTLRKLMSVIQFTSCLEENNTVSLTNINQLMRFRQLFRVYFQDHVKHVNRGPF
jgi:hypothetical protein